MKYSCVHIVMAGRLVPLDRSSEVLLGLIMAAIGVGIGAVANQLGG